MLRRKNEKIKNKQNSKDTKARIEAVDKISAAITSCIIKYGYEGEKFQDYITFLRKHKQQALGIKPSVDSANKIPQKFLFDDYFMTQYLCGKSKDWSKEKEETKEYYNILAETVSEVLEQQHLKQEKQSLEEESHTRAQNTQEQVSTSESEIIKKYRNDT